eukprot:scaffold262830_cov79-Cyclotella_meneghiniana.AAC.1
MSPRQSCRRRLLLATCCVPIQRAESFSLAQSASAADTKTPDDGHAATRTARSRAAVIAAGSSIVQFRQRNKVSKDDFALRMGQSTDLEYDASDRISMSFPDASTKASYETDMSHQDAQVIQRRKFLHQFVASTAALTTASAIDTDTSSHSSKKNVFMQEANAFDYTYPIELTSVPLNQEGQEENSSNSLSKLQQERLTNKRSKVLATQNEMSSDPLGFLSLSTPYEGILLVTGVSLWTLALWFISGSRSNPLVNPIANVLYDDQENQWLRDRNDGYFSEYPKQLTIVMGIIFLLFGIVADRSVYFLADGEVDIPVELGGVAALGGAFWEVGRLAAGEKGATKQESDRDDLIQTEFEEFANRRLITGRSTSNVHRSELVKAFRRFNPKYRVENEEYPLSDIEIERVARRWARSRGIEMSSAGFFSGVGIDSNADAFAPR